jgi:hypothetical protein
LIALWKNVSPFQGVYLLAWKDLLRKMVRKL